MRKTAAVAAMLMLLAGANEALGADAGVAVPRDPRACAPGFVHRFAIPADRICVTPQSRDRVVQENKDAPSRVDSHGAYGPNSCVAGYVWREAFEGDVVCVTPSVRSIVRQENMLGPERLLASQAVAIDTDDEDASTPMPIGPWLCGEETTSFTPASRNGHVIDRQGRVWAYGYTSDAGRMPYDWRLSDTPSISAEELNKRYAGATLAGRHIPVDEVESHLPLIEEAAKAKLVESVFHGGDETGGETALYCLTRDDSTGTYGEVVLVSRGHLISTNPSPAARELIDWIQPHFRIVD